MKKTITRSVRNKADISSLCSYLGNLTEFPLTVRIEKGVEKRSSQQNRLQRLWVNEAENQGDMSAEEYRGYCKLYFGVPILRNEDEEFREIYDSVIRPLQYEQKLQLMMIPIDLPVTSRMNTKQKTKYLDQMYQHLKGLGFILTDPNTLGLDQHKEAK